MKLHKEEYDIGLALHGKQENTRLRPQVWLWPEAVAATEKFRATLNAPNRLNTPKVKKAGHQKVKCLTCGKVIDRRGMNGHSLSHAAEVKRGQRTEVIQVDEASVSLTYDDVMEAIQKLVRGYSFQGKLDLFYHILTEDIKAIDERLKDFLMFK